MNAELKEMPWERLKFSSALDFIEKYPELKAPIVDGVFRRGETCNVIGSTKAGKSWLILGLALSIADGRRWLGKETTQGRVALVDNEIHPETLAGRIRRVASDMMVEDEVLRDNVHILPLRGDLASLPELEEPLKKFGPFDVCCLDAFYRLIPYGVSENDNAAMTSIYNAVDSMARSLDCAFVLNHHSSKGDQSGKRVTDIGSGAGAISRAADTHLTIREHAEPELAVLDAACRSFPPLPRTSLRFTWPLWSEESTPALLKGADPKKQVAEPVKAVTVPEDPYSNEFSEPLIQVAAEGGQQW